ncbi:S8 family serine peptidase [Streptomyces sp. NBC_01262]|uniref:S8 family serine peptidase n=1 Tax=Streptomyces sp. NBC_01262 TaxID=2903803 RepID=UPI002E378CA2|nr:S8 family serine peptidase [Streptomyces sp. NBC_01262]
MSAPVASADQVREDQWALKAFDAEAIWKVSKGKGVTVAVIDSGVNAQHVDLKGSVTEGKDFIDGGATTPNDNHGTGMASIIAGRGHGASSADGVMGLAPEASILDIRDDGGDADGLAGSIRYAVDRGASVINMSLGNASNVPAESKAVAYALQHDVLVVAASGNDGTPDVTYPANYPGALAVGAVKNDGTIWEDSNYGSSVLLSAPGTHIVSASADSDTGYHSGTGTSDATAYVSAAAALLRAKFPDLTAGQIANRLTKTAGLPSSAKGLTLPDKHYGYGYIQPLAALTKDIPAGSKYGPLAVPTSLQGNESASASPQSGTSDDASASSSSSDSGSPLLWIGLGIVGVLVLVLVIVLIVKASRRNNNRGGGPGGGAPGTYGPGPAPQGYPVYPPSQQNPYQQPPQGQWQGQGQGQWPNQQ